MRKVDEHLIYGIHMDILRGNVFEIDIINPSAVFHIVSHSRRCGNIAESQGGVSFKFYGVIRFAIEFMMRCIVFTLSIDLLNLLDYFKQSCSAGDTVSFQRRRNRKADGFLGPADIRNHKVCGKRIKPARYTLNGGIKAF